MRNVCRPYTWAIIHSAAVAAAATAGAAAQHSVCGVRHSHMWGAMHSAAASATAAAATAGDTVAGARKPAYTQASCAAALAQHLVAFLKSQPARKASWNNMCVEPGNQEGPGC